MAIALQSLQGTEAGLPSGAAYPAVVGLTNDLDGTGDPMRVLGATGHRG